MYRKILFFILIIVITTAQSHELKLQDSLGIIGGREISIEDAPYMAYIKMFRHNNTHTAQYRCGGSIIHERFILTAAHCVPKNIHEALVIVGSSKPESFQHLSAIANKIFCHEDYNDDTLENDICILKLYGPLPFDSKVRKIALPKEDFAVTEDDLANVNGWGCIKEHSTKMSSVLRQVKVNIISNEDCRVDQERRVPDIFICAGIYGFKDSCKGDSGGPLVLNGVQIGIVSHSEISHNAHPETLFSATTRYIKVSKYLNWIHNVIENNL